jgi:AbrB family looped-hinge helix DNA binding protein
MQSIISEKGQVTVPKPLRDRLGIKAGDRLDFTEANNQIVVKKVTDRDPVATVYGILDTGRSTDEIIEELRGPVDTV